MKHEEVLPTQGFEALLYQEELEERVEFVDWSAKVECETDFSGSTTAYDLLARSPKSRQATILASRYLGPRFTLGGQAIDLRGLNRPLSMSRRHDETRVARLKNRKTSGLITLALHLGALHGRVTRRQASALSQIGSELGNAFQLADDIMDGDGAYVLDSGIGDASAPMASGTTMQRLKRHVERADALLHDAFVASEARTAMTAAVRQLSISISTKAAAG